MKRLSNIFHRNKRESPRLPRDLTQDEILMRSDDSDSDKDGRNGRASIDLTDFGPTKSRPVSNSRAPISAASSESHLDRDTIKKLRDELFRAMSNDDVEAVKSAIQDIQKHKLTLEMKELRDPHTDMTVLHTALDQRKLLVASYLIESQSKSFLSASFVNISKQIPPSKKTGLHLAAEVGDKERMEKLLQQLSASDDKLDFADDWLRMSSDFKTEEVVIMMPPPIYKRRLSTIHIAAMNGHSQLIETLLSYGFDVNCEDSDSETPLILAVRLGHLQTIKELITNKANVDHANNYGSTALHHAVSQGRKDIVKLLLEEGKADLNIERIKSPKTPIEMAANRNEVKLAKGLLRGNIELEYRHRALMITARKGNSDIVKCLIESDTDKKLINRPDVNGNTALLKAANGNYLPIVKYLVNESADLSWKNHARQTVFDIAMLHPNNSVLQFLLQIQRSKRRDREKEAFYLHVAAANGDIKKIEYVLASGFDFYALDELQNTFLHTAASYNKPSVIEKFITPYDDIDTLRNSEGETPLHIAARRGYIDCVVQLIKNKSKLNLVDKNGHNPLHAALTSTTISTRVVAALIEAIKESYYVGILNEQDTLGRTALHFAAAGKKPDILRLLLDLDPEIENKAGDTPLHVAVEFGTVEVLKTYLEEFCVRLKKGKIDHKDAEGFSALHRCVMVANAEKVGLMLHHGADLSLTDEEGKTILHTMVDSYVNNPTYHENLVEVYKIIAVNATKWYCWKNDMRMPKEESKEFFLTQMDAVRLLTSEMFSRGQNVLQYASKRGADKLLKEILNTLNIYRFNKNRPMPLKGRGLDELADRGCVHKQQAQKRWLLMILKKEEVIFDVTYLVPQLMPTPEINAVGNVVSKDDHAEMWTSCLEQIINQGNEVLALRFLKEVPFRSLVSNYWKLCRRTYEALMWIHVTFMVCFTYFVMPSHNWLHWRFGTNSSTVESHNYSSNPSEDYPPYLFGIFLLWPVFNLLYTFVYTLETLFYLRCKKKLLKPILTKQKQNVGEITSGLLRFPIGILLYVFDNLSVISSLCFGTTHVAWYIMFIHADNAHPYLECLGMAFIFGWLHTISFVKGFKDWSAMAVIFKQILLKDISRFIYIYVFILISFGYAIHAIIQADYHLNPDYRSLTTTIYLTFYWMLNPGDVLLVSESDEYKRSGGSITVLRAVCSAYSILSSVILMNMLIAMMNGTYSDVKADISASWRIGSLRTALWFERYFPLRRLKLLRMKHTLYDATQNRWYMTYEPEDGEEWDPKEKQENESDTEDEEEDGDKPTPERTLLEAMKAEISELRDEMKAKNEEIQELMKSMNDVKSHLKQLHEICRETAQLSRIIRPE